MPNRNLNSKINAPESEHSTIETAEINTDMEMPYDEPNAETNKSLNASDLSVVAEKLEEAKKKKSEQS